jgi:saccharopine dehydrogenase (NAD+, L-lysine forming)
MTDQRVTLLLRAETKPGERRTLLLPQDAVRLAAHELVAELLVERSVQRCVDDDEYAGVHDKIRLVQEGYWADLEERGEGHSPNPRFCVLGLKEVSETAPVGDVHVSFAHIFKGQRGWVGEMLRRHDEGGTLLDLEFLVTDDDRRVAAFGHSAGFVGMALGLQQWNLQVAAKAKSTGSAVPLLPPLREAVRDWDALVGISRIAKDGSQDRRPRVAIVGAKGRVGSGAAECALRCGILPEDLLLWDIEETRGGGPFPALVVDADILVNCIFLGEAIQPFVTPKMLDDPRRRLSVVVDCSCDATNPHNPIPLYPSTGTSFDDPVVRVHTSRAEDAACDHVDVIAIDHLPSLVPSESSGEFSRAMMPYLERLPQYLLSRSAAVHFGAPSAVALNAPDWDPVLDTVWGRSEAVFNAMREVGLIARRATHHDTAAPLAEEASESCRDLPSDHPQSPGQARLLRRLDPQRDLAVSGPDRLRFAILRLVQRLAASQSASLCVLRTIASPGEGDRALHSAHLVYGSGEHLEGGSDRPLPTATLHGPQPFTAALTSLRPLVGQLVQSNTLPSVLLRERHCAFDDVEPAAAQRVLDGIVPPPADRESAEDARIEGLFPMVFDFDSRSSSLSLRYDSRQFSASRAAAMMDELLTLVPE